MVTGEQPLKTERSWAGLVSGIGPIVCNRQNCCFWICYMFYNINIWYIYIYILHIYLAASSFSDLFWFCWDHVDFFELPLFTSECTTAAVYATELCSKVTLSGQVVQLIKMGPPNFSEVGDFNLNFTRVYGHYMVIIWSLYGHYMVIIWSL